MATPLIYLDSSVALRTILDVPERTRLQSWMQAGGATVVSSRLLRTEVIRILRRDRRPLADGTPLLERVGLIEISRETLNVAESIEPHVKTLGSLHLATALLLGEPVTVATHDRTMKTAAEYLGLKAADPVERQGRGISRADHRVTDGPADPMPGAADPTRFIFQPGIRRLRAAALGGQRRRSRTV